MISNLIKAGYLRPTQRNNADAITEAIARMKQDLRDSMHRSVDKNRQSESNITRGVANPSPSKKNPEARS